jgi:hypothetical protein
MTRIQIKGGEYPIGKIFGKDFVFRIPLYQRPYAWQQDQTEELLDDLLSFVGDGDGPVDDLNPYFLGNIVVIKEDHKPDADVVDGQQRLTTLAILLSVIRSLTNGDFAKGLTEFIYEKGNPVEETKDRFRLTLRDRDATFFQDYIQKEGQLNSLSSLDEAKLSDSQKNIRSNTIALSKRLKGFSIDACKRLAQFIIKQCFLVVVSTPDFESAYRIFTVLNSRGLDLSHADILKSEIVGKVSSEEQDKYGERWEDTEELLGRESFADLFSHIRTVYRKLKLKGTVLAEFRQYVMSEVKDSRSLIDDVIVPYANAFSDIREANYESSKGADDVNALLKWLGEIDNTDWLPSAILYMSQNTNAPDKLRQFLTDLERLAVMQMLTRSSINERIERYGRVINAIQKTADLYAKESPLHISSEEQKRMLCVLDGDVYNLLPKVRKYVMLRLDSALSGGGATYDHGVFSIEHVLPQQPKAGSLWESWFPDSAEREQLVHRLGNLVILSRRKNSSASNYDFDKKKASYFTKDGVSPFQITTQVVSEKTWTPVVIERRQTELVAKLKAVWHL